MSDSSDDQQSNGRVKEATRDWTMKTDEVLAHRLQEEEISKHLTGNKSRNELIRVDYPAAAAVQKKVDEQARLRVQKIRKQAEEDAKIAWEIQRRQRNLQEVMLPNNDFPSTSREYSQPSSSQRVFDGRLNNNNLDRAMQMSSDGPCSSSENAISRDILNGNQDDIQNARAEEHSDISLREIEVALGVPMQVINEERRRLIQEERDAEIAKKLSFQKAYRPYDESDREFARSLQAKEYQRYIKNREKQRIKTVQSHAAAVAQSASRSSGSETYSRPLDCLQGAAQSPYYMEPMHPEQQRQASLDRNLRAPPAPPRNVGGRPRMAEPVISEPIQHYSEYYPSTSSSDSSEIGASRFKRWGKKFKKDKKDKKDKKKDNKKDKKEKGEDKDSKRDRKLHSCVIQ